MAGSVKPSRNLKKHFKTGITVTAKVLNPCLNLWSHIHLGALMKAAMILMTSCLLLETAQAQTSISTTNQATVAEALKIASGLQFHMTESDADQYLANHGILCDPGSPQVVLQEGYATDVGLTWTINCPLKEYGGFLELDFYHPDSPDTWTNTETGWEQEGILEGAQIKSNWVEFSSVRLAHSENMTSPATVAETIKIASGLQAGMKENEADAYLYSHGIGGWVSDTSRGDNGWWTTSRSLTGPFGLELDYSNADTLYTTNWRAFNGPLEKAEIDSNDVAVISIALKNSE